MRVARFTVVAVLTCVAVIGCDATPVPSTGAMGSTSESPSAVRAGAQLLGPADFAAALAAPGSVGIDVHVPFEGKLQAADLMIPFDEIATRATELPADHATPLAVYCMSGNMSATAVRELDALGYTDIVELDGGMSAWIADGRALLTAG